MKKVEFEGQVVKRKECKRENFDYDLAGVEHVGGDMFEKVPNGDAVFMKVCFDFVIYLLKSLLLFLCCFLKTNIYFGSITFILYHVV